MDGGGTGWYSRCYSYLDGVSLGLQLKHECYMNVPTDIAKQVVESLRGTPFVLALVMINIIALVGFGFILSEVSNAMERREGLIKACIERK